MNQLWLENLDKINFRECYNEGNSAKEDLCLNMELK